MLYSEACIAWFTFLEVTPGKSKWQLVHYDQAYINVLPKKLTAFIFCCRSVGRLLLCVMDSKGRSLYLDDTDVSLCGFVVGLYSVRFQKCWKIEKWLKLCRV